MNNYEASLRLKQASNYLIHAINYEASNKNYSEHCLNQACLFELVGLGFCSLMKGARPKVDTFPIENGYIRFDKGKYKAISTSVH